MATTHSHPFKQFASHATMNSSRDYNDDLDGEFLACSPGNNAVGLEFICTVGFPVIGLVMLLNGIWLLVLAFTIQGRHRASSPRTRNESNMKTSRARHLSTQTKYATKVLLASGFNMLGCGLISIIYNFGTMYPTTHWRGQVGDILICFQNFMLCYLNILQQAGAKIFKQLIPEQQQRTQSMAPFKLSAWNLLHRSQIYMCLCIYVGIWLLLRADVITRGWSCALYSTMGVLLGCRTVFTMLSMRFATLKRVAAITRAQPGAKEVQVCHSVTLSSEFADRNCANLVWFGFVAESS
jgi:hypothetical protein